MSLVHNERIKLRANALDRLSTAFLAVGALGKVFDIVPTPLLPKPSALRVGFSARLPTFDGAPRFGKADAMTTNAFFWYVFPWLVTAAATGWLLYDRRSKDRLHPGE